MSHPAWIEIDLGALAHNARVIRRAIPPGCRLGLMVKANGYGHGIELAARAAAAAGADLLMVASLDEALAVRSAGVAAPLLVVYPILPAGVADAVAAQVQLSVSSLAGARELLGSWRAAQPVADGLRLHAEVDTGMGRGGVAPKDLPDLLASIDAVPGTTLASIWSHLAEGTDGSASREQVRRFEAALAPLAAAGRRLPMRHIAATEGVFCATAPAWDMVRVGLGYYGDLGLGVEPSPAMASLAAELRTAMTVKARRVRLEGIPAGASVGYGREWVADRPSLIATLPLGYADGWTRQYWPGASVLVHGRRVPLVGRVSMDSVCADVTDVGEVGWDDVFVLLGEQDGERITVRDLSEQRGSIPNEVFCAFGPRLARIGVGADDGSAVQPGVDAGRAG